MAKKANNEKKNVIKIQNKLRDVSKITKLINLNDTIIVDKKTGEMIDKNNDIKHFAIFFDQYQQYECSADDSLKDAIGIPEKDEEEKILDYENFSEKEKNVYNINKTICRELNIMHNRFPSSDFGGWYIVPIMEDQTEFCPILIEEISKEEFYLVMQEKPLFTMNPSPVPKEDKSWNFTSFYHIMDRLKEMRNGIYIESVFHHNSNRHNINELSMATKRYDAAKSMRIKVSNNIRSNLYVTIGKKLFNELKQEIADNEKIDIKNVDIFSYIEKEYSFLNSKIVEENMGGDNSKKLVNYILTQKRKNDIDMDKIDAYIKKLNAKINDTFIKDEEHFKELKERYSLRFITSFCIYNQIREYYNYSQIEKESEEYMKSLVHRHPYWNRYLVSVTAVAEITAAYIICGFNTAVARHPSSFVRYIGMDQVPVKPKERVVTDEIIKDSVSILVRTYFTKLFEARQKETTINHETYLEFGSDVMPNYKDFMNMGKFISEYGITKNDIYNNTLDDIIEESLENIKEDTKDYTSTINYVVNNIVVQRKKNSDNTENVYIKKRSRNKGDVVSGTYISKDGNIEVRNTLGYNAKLKAKIVGVWGENVLKLGGIDNKTGEYKSHFAKYYYEKKAMYENRKDLVDQLNKALAGEKDEYGVAYKKPNFHVMARRAMAQSFVESCWFAFRIIDGYPIDSGTYAEAKLGYVHMQEKRPHVLNKPCLTKEDYKAYKKNM